MILNIYNKGKLYKHNVTISPFEGKLLVQSAYDPALVEEIKNLEGAKWEPVSKTWTIADSERNKFALDFLQTYKYPEHFTTPIPYIEGRRNLFHHQKEALSFMYTRKRCMFAGEMGVGKTLTSIELMELVAAMHQKFNWWVIAPLGAQAEWHRQLKKWVSFIHPAFSTYESVHHLMDAASEPPDGVIFDESVKIKTPSARRSQYASELCRLVRERDGYIILLSGAPAPKDPSDWWHQIECIQPGFLREGTIHSFRNRYAVIEYEEGPFGKYPKVVGWREDEVEKLGRRLAPLVFVKRKKDCLDLPDKVYETLSTTVDEELLKRARMISRWAASPLQALERLRELSDGFQYDHETDLNGVPTHKTTTLKLKNNPKLHIVNELLDFYALENGGPGRLVIYAAFQGSVDLLEEHVRTKEWYPRVIDGRTTDRETVLDDFDSEPLSNVVIIANPQCVHGLNLQRTEALVYYSNSFSVDARIQSLDRRDRPGMDTTKGTRIVDIINLPIDLLIRDKLNKGIEVQNITLEEIQQCLQA